MQLFAHKLIEQDDFIVFKSLLCCFNTCCMDEFISITVILNVTSKIPTVIRF